MGAAKFVADHAPPGMLATVTGLQGGAHNGLGKGFGGLLGGFTIETTKSTHKAFRLFGFSCAGVSVLYILIVSLTALRRRYRPRPARDGKVSSLSALENITSDEFSTECSEGPPGGRPGA